MLSAALRRTTHFATQFNPTRAYATTAKMTDPSKYKRKQCLNYNSEQKKKGPFI